MSASYAAAKTMVLWDIEDFKIPDGLDADEVAKNIKTVIAEEIGLGGTVSIEAYADETNQIQDSVFDSAGIKLIRLPEGPKGKDRSRDMAIQAGMFGWAYENREDMTLIMVISHNRFTSTVDMLKERNYNVFCTSLSADGKPIPHVPHQCGC